MVAFGILCLLVCDGNTKLLEQVEELRGSRMTLTADEEKLFSDPSVREMLGSDSIQGTLIAKAPKPAGAASTEKPVDTLLDKANEAFSAQKFAEAAALYEDALRVAPDNTTALVGLGYSREREKKYPEAEAALKKCLIYDPNNEMASFHLGVTYFKQERWNDAMSSFEKNLAINAKNAPSRHYLGIIATKLNFIDRAEREFKTALAIDPNYGEAHFNLAVIYATGYRTSFPFLDPAVFAVRDGQAGLYRRILAPDRPGLFFAGLVQPIGPTIPLVEIKP